MTDKRIPLALAAFMDSAHAVRLPAPSSEEIRTIAERLLEAAYTDMGRPPEELDGDHLRELCGQWLPRRFEPDDPLVPHVPEVIAAFLANLEDVAVVAHTFELKLAMDEAAMGFLEGMQRREGGRIRSGRETGTVVHKAARTGRNDPCPCGSGKKFKKCHGR